MRNKITLTGVVNAPPEEIEKLRDILKVKKKEDHKRAELGSPPWDSRVLIKAYYEDAEYVMQQMRQHRGFTIFADIASLKHALDVFDNSFKELCFVIDKFTVEEKSGSYWHARNKSRREYFDREIRNRMFFCSSSAYLVYSITQERCKRYIDLNQYADKVKEIFKEHGNLIVRLRAYSTHISVVNPGPMFIYGVDANDHYAGYIINGEDLNQIDGLNGDAKSYLKGKKDGVDVKRLFSEYKMCVDKFYQWFFDNLDVKSKDEMAEYLKYEKTITCEVAKSEWNILFQIAMDNNKDPYEYVKENLSAGQLKRFDALSSIDEKADYLILTLDEYGCCDATIKKKLKELLTLSSR